MSVRYDPRPMLLNVGVGSTPSASTGAAIGARTFTARTRAIALLWLLGWTFIVWPRAVRPNWPAWDFGINRDAAIALRTGAPLYAPNIDDRRFSSFIGPPSTAFLHLPFSTLPADRALLIYRLIISAVFAAGVVVASLALTTSARGVGLAVGAAALVLWHPVFTSLVYGQVDAWIVLALGSAAYFARRGRWVFTGIAIGLAAVLKISPAVALLYCAANRRRWPAIAGAAVSIAGAVLVTLPFEGLRPWIDFATRVAPSLAHGTIHLDNQSVPGFLVRNVFQTAGDALGPWSVLTPLIALGGAALVVRADGRNAHEPLALSAMVLVGLMAGPITWNHYESWAIVPLVVACDADVWTRIPDSRRRGFAITSIAVACIFSAQFSPRPHSVFLALSQLGTIGLVAGFATIVALLRATEH